MPANIGLYSYGFALVAYALLGILILFTRKRRELEGALLAATLITALWAGTVALSTLLTYPLIEVMQLTEWARNAAWCFVLFRLLGLRLEGTGHILTGKRWIPWFVVGFTIALGALFATPVLPAMLSLPEGLFQDLPFLAWLAMAVLGLMLLEQLYRNSTESERWSVKHLCLGLGLIFAYDFFMYAEALLLRHLDPALWQARGIVAAVGTLFLAIAIGRYSREKSRQNLYLSRHVVFHSVTLLAAGIYLLLMALVGYFIRYLGGTWGGVLQIAFLSASGVLLLALLFSGQIRARTRVWLSKNFFSYKYDYRTEWLQFTKTLAEGSDDIPENIVRAMAHLTKSPGGLLWSRSVEGQFRLACNWAMAEPEPGDQLQALPAWLERSEWIIDLREWRNSPDVYQNLEMPKLLLEMPQAWLIIPMFFGEQLQGILLLRESDLHPDINWEDRDLLKVAGRQAASHLAQYEANQALVESRQFEAFNRLSAYVIHDLKNILAQQSLIVSNAERHRNNPAFIDDVISTVRNSVERMTRLMEQMRNGVRGAETQRIDLGELLQKVVTERQNSLPVPGLHDLPPRALLVDADRDLLATVFAHLIQNAQEASNRSGTVDVRLQVQGEQAVVEIEDTGIGMDEDFLRNRLFKPFDSTKGLTGMGIGAFESREFVRSLGGEIRVTSTPGAGSLFRIVLPCAPESAALNMENKEAVGG